MNILTEANEQGRLQIEKIELRLKKKTVACLDWLVDEDKTMQQESITINNIRDWEMDYNKIGTSSFTVTFLGAVPALLGAIHDTVTSISVYGKVLVYKSGKQNNLVWNIPCDLKFEDLEVNGGEDGENETYLNLFGDLW